jgi:pilus assembly protein CpaB
MTSRLLAERQQQQVEVPKVKVLVAKTKVPSFTVLKEPEKYFEEKEVPEGTFPKKALTSLDDIRDKRLAKAISEENFVLVDDILTQENSGLAATLPPGMRAVAIKVNAESSTAGFVVPHSRVDVIATVRRGDSESESKIILQNMLVLAVDQKHNKELDGGPTILGQTVTLAATPEEAQQLALAGAVGELRLILRGAGDNEISRFRPSKISDLGRQRVDALREKSDEDLVAAGSLLPTSIPEPPRVGLPPVAPVLPMVEEEPKVEEPPPVTHTLTIINGDATSRVVFVKDKDGGWNAQVTAGQPLEAPRRRNGSPVPPPPAAPAPATGTPAAPPVALPPVPPTTPKTNPVGQAPAAETSPVH